MRADQNEQFCRGYVRPLPMTFEQALPILKRGERLSRKVWPQGTSLAITGDKLKPSLEITHPNGHKTLYWNISPGDILAEDWTTT